MPRTQPRKRPPPASPVSSPEAEPNDLPRDLADRRDVPVEGHANVGPDDRTSGHYDDIETEGAERIPELDSAVIDGVAGRGDPP
jgi:hypothetical protein